MANVSLKIGDGSPRILVNGEVVIVGGSVCLIDKSDNTRDHLVFAYMMRPGETVVEEGSGSYVVRF